MSNPFTKTIRATLLLTTLPMLGLVSQPTLAASDCKGLAQDACAAKEHCRWMNGYTRKDGIQVSSHCRIGKPSKASDSPASIINDKDSTASR
ncbi:hypothetical protein [Thiocystis violacea]|uniref:hypothetical protein n=1 Tax=Thiocystis violacea TaxID=13725 RepID=UPI0019060E53|nr:hypothetical protein [Thiocystis violacea]